MTIRAALRQPLADCAGGGLAVQVALMRLLIEAETATEAERAVEAAISGEASLDGRERLSGLLALLRDSPRASATLRGVIDGLSHEGEEPAIGAGLARWAEGFDRAVVASPEASVALYSLGRSDLLAAATGEIAEAMAGWGLLGPDRDLLDIGCGIGRLEAALATRVRTIVGIDISAGMIAEARRRCANLGNVSFRQSEGRDLSPFGDAGFDSVVAVDCFPYLVQVGGDLARRHVVEARRVLRPGGRLLILNLSYRGDDERDRRDARAFADEAGCSLLLDGVRPFTSWDGAAFLFARPG